MRVVVEDAHLAIEDQRAGWQTADGGGDLTKPLGVVDATAADEADAAPVLVGDHAPAVVLFLVNVAPRWNGLVITGWIGSKSGSALARDTAISVARASRTLTLPSVATSP